MENHYSGLRGGIHRQIHKHSGIIASRALAERITETIRRAGGKLTHDQVFAAVQLVFSHILEAVAGGESVVIPKVGRFSPRLRRGKRIRSGLGQHRDSPFFDKSDVYYLGFKAAPEADSIINRKLSVTKPAHIKYARITQSGRPQKAVVSAQAQ